MPASQFDVLKLWGCFDNCEEDWTEKFNESMEILWTELTGKCVCGDEANNTVTNTEANFPNPVPGTAIVDANGCLTVYSGPIKGWLTNPPVCGREIFDTKTKTSYKWDDSAWKITSTCETVLSTTVAQKAPSVYPTGTNSYNTTSTPWVEFQTIDGVWIETGRVFDPATCKITQCLAKAEVKDGLLLKAQLEDPAAAGKITAPATLPTGDDICLSFGVGKMWKVFPDGSLKYVACQNDLPILCAADDAAAEALWLAKCFIKQDGIFYFNTTTNRLKICKGGVWLDSHKDLDCSSAFVGAAEDGFLSKLNSEGKLDNCFIDGYPQAASNAAYEAKIGTPTGGERYYNTTDGRVYVYDAIAGLWRDEAEPQPEECFIMNYTNTGGLIAPGPVNVWNTYPLNTVVTTPVVGGWATGLPASQFKLTGINCCYMLDYKMYGFRMGLFIMRLFDITNNIVVPNSYSDPGVSSGSNTGDPADTADHPSGCAEVCITAETVYEIQYIRNSSFTSNAIAPSTASLPGVPIVPGTLKVNKKRSF